VHDARAISHSRRKLLPPTFSPADERASGRCAAHALELDRFEVGRLSQWKVIKFALACCARSAIDWVRQRGLTQWARASSIFRVTGESVRVDGKVAPVGPAGDLALADPLDDRSTPSRDKNDACSTRVRGVIWTHPLRHRPQFAKEKSYSRATPSRSAPSGQSRLSEVFASIQRKNSQSWPDRGENPVRPPKGHHL
jgi:hypothetical protein